MDYDQNFIDLIASCPADFKAALDSLPIGVIATNSEGVVIYYNTAHSLIDEIDRETMLGSVEMELLKGTDLLGLCQKYARPFLGFIYPYRTFKNKEINAAFWDTPIYKDGKVVAAICFTQVIDTDYDKKQTKYKHWPATATINTPASRMVGSSQIFSKAVNQARQGARGPLPVLLTGATGTGKEVFARYIHRLSSRREGPFLAINCAAIPGDLLEGMLSGTTKGSFTGALDRPGLFEEASGGILYLDELDSMPLSLQPKLLRVLQEMSVRRLGSSKEKSLDVKLISSISCPLHEAIDKGRMRPDISYRLAVLTVEIPSLKDRLDDLEELINYFLFIYNDLLGRNLEAVEDGLLKLFYHYSWPGNVRELEHLLAGAANLADPEERYLDWDHLTETYKKIFTSLIVERTSSVPSPALGNNPPASEENTPTSEPFFTFPKTFVYPAIPNDELPAAINTPPAAAENSPAVSTAADSGSIRRSWIKEREQAEKEEIEAALRASVGNVTMAAEFLGMSRQQLTYRLSK